MTQSEAHCELQMAVDEALESGLSPEDILSEVKALLETADEENEDDQPAPQGRPFLSLVKRDDGRV
jgi:hypothetical protein